MFADWKGLVVATGTTVLLAASYTGSAVAEDCTVRIGATGPLSGAAVAWGLSAKLGTEFAAALVNKDGGLKVGEKRCQAKVVSFDAQYTAVGGAAASNYFASENIHVVLGPVGSPETTGFRPVAKRNNQVNFSSSYMRDAISPEFPLAFHALQTPLTWGPIIIKRAKDQFGFKTVLITAPNDQGGTDGGRQLAKLYGDVGVQATEEYYQRGTTNFAPLAQRIMNAKPDAIEFSSVPPVDGIGLVKALREAGYSGVLGALGGTGLKSLAEGAGGVENLNSVYWLEINPADNPGIIKMKEDYRRLMGAEPPENSLFPTFVLASEVALQGISLAGTDQDAERIAEAMRKSVPESRYMGKAGWRGKTLNGINQELTFPVGLGMIVNGKRLPVQTVEIPTE